MADAGLIGEASIDWDHLDADDHENLEKLTARKTRQREARDGRQSSSPTRNSGCSTKTCAWWSSSATRSAIPIRHTHRAPRTAISAAK
jgi:hypothetical protein